MQDDVLMTNPESSESQEFTTLPLLALRDVVVYPQMQIALFVVAHPRLKQSSLRKTNLTIKYWWWHKKTHYLKTLMPAIYLNMVRCAVSSIPCHMKMTKIASKC